MKKIFTLSLSFLIAPFLVNAQNVGVDVAVPTQKLDVAGALKIGSTTTGGAGSMRWNGTNFEVHDGTQWIAFGTGTDNDWTITGVDMYSVNSGNVGIGTTTPATKLQVVGTVRVDGLEMGTQYSFPTLDGTNGYVLTTDGSGNVTWSDPAAVGDITEVIAGDGLINGGASGAVTVDVNPGDGITIFADEVRVRALDLEGDGLTVTSNNFDLNVDNSTVEVNADVLRVKADGITANEIATGAVTTTEILDGTIVTGDIATGGVTTLNILDGTVSPADVGPGGAGQILATDPTGTSVSWVNPATVTPGLADDDDDTKVQVEESPDEDKIRFDTQGVERMVIDEVGNVGIGVATPTYKLDIDGDVGVNGRVYHNGDPNTSIQYTPDRVRVYAGSTSSTWIDIQHSDSEMTINEQGIQRDLRIETGNDANALVVDGSSDNVGIGTAAPAAKFEVAGTARVTELNVGGNYSLPLVDGANTYLMQTDGTGTVAWVDPSSVLTQIPTQISDADLDTKIEVEQNPDEDHIRMSTLGVERLTIDDAGQVGIGTVTPDRDLHIANDNGGTLVLTRNDGVPVAAGDVLGELMFDSEANSGPSPTDASALIRGIASEGQGDSDKGGHMAFLTKPNTTDNTAVATERMRITEDGNVGVGVTAPTANLDVAGDANGTPDNSLLLRSGNNNSETISNQIMFSWDGGTNYKHALKTRHQNASDIGNAFDFYVWDQGTDAAGAVGTKRVMTIDGRDQGMVGIGESVPRSELHISDGSPSLKAANDAGGYGASILITDNAIPRIYFEEQNEPADKKLMDIHLIGQKLRIGSLTDNAFAWDNANILVVDRDGQVGIMTGNPQDELHVAGSIRMVDGGQAAGYIPVSDANGTMAWTAPGTALGGYIDAGNGLTETTTAGLLTIDAVALNGLTTAADDIRLGGPLVQNTTVTMEAFDMNFNLNAAGDFNVQDAGTTHFQVSSIGRSYFGDDVYWRDGSVTGTTMMSLIDDGDDGRLRIYENGSTSVDLDANSQFIFNEQGLDRNLRIESDTDANNFFSDAGNNRVGIGTGTPSMKLQVNEAGGNSLTLVRNDATTTTNEQLGGIGFDATDGGVETSLLNSSAAVVAFATEDQGTADKGAYLTLRTKGTNADFGVTNTERVRIEADGDVGIGTTNPTAKLQIDETGTSQALNVRNTSASSVGQVVNVQRTSAPASANDILQITVPATSPNDFQFAEFDRGGTVEFAVDGDGDVHFEGALEPSGNAGTSGQYLRSGGGGTPPTWVTIPGVNGDITGVNAGDGLTGGGTSGTVTLNVVATNGLTDNANDIRLGGTLIQNTTINQDVYSMNYNLNSSGDFNILDNGTIITHFRDDGVLFHGDDMYWRDGSYTGTNLMVLLDDGNDGRLLIYENGVTSVDLDANSQFVFNEQGLDRDFRIESDADANQFRVNAGLNRVGIGDANPTTELEIGSTDGQTLMLSRQDGTITSGEQLGGIGFDGSDGNTPDDIREASASIIAFASETHGTGDKGGRLTFWTSPINQNDDTDGFERMRIDQDGTTYVGGDMYWRDASVTGTNIARIVDDGNDGQMILYEDGGTQILLDANGTSVFNELSRDRNLRVESDGNANMLFVDGGTNRVGIGTGAPSTTMHIAGQLRIDGVAATSSNTRILTVDGSGNVRYRNPGSWSGGADNLGNHSATTSLDMNTSDIYEVNRVITRATSDYDKLRVYSSSNYTIGMHSGMGLGFLNDWAMTFTMNNDADRGWVWRDVNDATSDGAMSLTTGGRLYVKGNSTFASRVGIGTTATTYPLYVTTTNSGNWQGRFTNGNSNVYLAHQSGYGIHINTGGTNSTGRYAFEVRNANQTHFYVRDDGGIVMGEGGNPGGDQVAVLNPSNNPRLTIGSTDVYNNASSGRLSFDENVIASGTNSCGFLFHHDGSANELRLSAGCTGHTSLMTWERNLRVGIRTNAPTQTLSVAGSAGKTGGGAWAGFSDRRIKKDIIPYEDGLDKILQINPVKYKFIEDYGMPEDPNKEFIGVVAQDMQKIAPYMVESTMYGREEAPETDADGGGVTKEGRELLMYDPSALDYMLINAVKEQQAIIDALMKRVEELESQK